MSQTFKSFKEVAQTLGVKLKKEQPKEEKVIKCRICGSPMRHISNTNVYVCDGMKKGKDGKEIPCENTIYIITSSNS